MQRGSRRAISLRGAVHDDLARSATHDRLLIAEDRWSSRVRKHAKTEALHCRGPRR